MNFKFVLSRFPFNWENPIGYAIAVTLQFMIYLKPARYLTCFLSLGAGVYVLLISSTGDGCDILRSINDAAKAKQTQEHIFKHFSTFVGGHSELKQLSY